MEIFGAVIVNGTEYVDNEIAKLVGQTFGLHGVDWKYAGDQDFESSNIYLDLGQFGTMLCNGRYGLPNALVAIELAAR